MTTAWLLNLTAYSVQLTTLVASALALAGVLRLRAPKPALWFWQAMLVAAIMLPFAPSRVPGSSDALTSSTLIVGRALSGSSIDLTRLTSMAIAVLVGGAAGRLAWLALGLVRLRVIRQRSRALAPTPALVDDLTRRLGIAADIRISDDVDGPVTIGMLRPTVLLPARALTLPHQLQQAIVCHELLHVRRHDWAQTVLEQIWCALLWFHPAARVLVSHIALMREALVDRQTVAITADRRAYAHALMIFAEPTERVPLVAPSLIRPGFLAQRIALLAQEASMSRGHILTAFALGFAVVCLATAVTASRFPITPARPTAGVATMSTRATGQDEAVRPGNGVSAPIVIREVKPQYTPAALQAKIQGSVEMDLVVLPSGDPSAIRITRSLDAGYGLDEAAMEAAAQWKFEPGRRDSTPVPVTVTLEMRFALK